MTTTSEKSRLTRDIPTALNCVNLHKFTENVPHNCDMDLSTNHWSNIVFRLMPLVWNHCMALLIAVLNVWHNVGY